MTYERELYMRRQEQDHDLLRMRTKNPRQLYEEAQRRIAALAKNTDSPPPMNTGGSDNG